MNVYYQTKNTQLDLFPHQLASLDFMLTRESNNILIYQKMGYGKTILALTYAMIKTNKSTKNIYILVPNYEVMSIWKNEIRKVMVILPFIYDINRIKFLTFNSFTTMINSNTTSDGTLPEWLVSEFDSTCILVDEAHKILGNTYEEALEFLRLNRSAYILILITATPVPNTPDALLSLINLIANKKLDPAEIYTKSQFIYENKVVDHIDKVITNHFTDRAVYYFPMDSNDIVQSKEMGIVYNPLTYYNIITCPMTGHQLDLYKTMIKTCENDMFMKSPVNIQLYAYRTEFTPSELNVMIQNIKQNKVKADTIISSSLAKTESIKYNSIADCFIGSSFRGNALKTTSCKLYYFINNIKDFGKSVLFFQNVEYGINIIKSIFNSNGISEYNSNYMPDDILCAVCSKHHTSQQNHVLVPAKFMILTGTKRYNTLPIDESINIINDEKNSNGHMVKYVIISEAFTVAYSFLRFDSIHLLTPRSTASEVKQTVARIIRKNSHPKDYPFVKIYHYCAMLGTEPKKTHNIVEYIKLYEKQISIDFKKFLYIESKNEEINKIEKGFDSLSSTENLPSSHNFILTLHKRLIIKKIFETETILSFEQLQKAIFNINRIVDININELYQMINAGFYTFNNKVGSSKLLSPYHGVFVLKQLSYYSKNPKNISCKLELPVDKSSHKKLASIVLIYAKRFNTYSLKIDSKPGSVIETIPKPTLLKILKRLDPSKVDDSLQKKELIEFIIELLYEFDKKNKQYTYVVET